MAKGYIHINYIQQCYLVADSDIALQGRAGFFLQLFSLIDHAICLIIK